MKKELLLLLLMGCMLVSCHSDLKFDNVDTTTQLDMGLALKIATVTATLGDFTDQSEDLFIYEEKIPGAESKMVIAWRHAYPDEKDYHAINFLDYLPEMSKGMNVYDQLQAKGLIGPDGKITPDGSQVTLDFDMQFKFSGVNEEGSNNENRIDSAYIDYAQFVSTIGRQDLPLEWEWIDSVVLDMGDQIECANKVRTVYRREDAVNDYGQPLETNLENFKIMLMKDLSIKPRPDNVYPGCNMKVHFMFTIPASAGEIVVPRTAAFQYNIKLADARWKAIWGYFTPSKDMESNELVDMDDFLHNYPFAKRAKLPFSDPQINVEVSTHIAGHMVIVGSDLYVIDANDQRIYATFKDSTTRTEHLKNSLDPADLSTLGDSVVNSILFDKTEELGNIEQMFKTMPKFLNYKFKVYFDKDDSPQIRITPNTKVRINAICTLPLMFERNMFIDYCDTITNVDLKDVDVDSLAKQVDFIDSLHVGNVTLYLTAHNHIPLTLKGNVRFMDANGQPVMDPEDPSKEFYPFLEDTIRFAPPKFIKTYGHIVLDDKNPGKTIITTRMNQKQLEALKQIKSIEYKVTADNDALQYAYDMGLDKIRLEKDSRLYIDMGVTTQLEAFMNFENKK